MEQFNYKKWIKNPKRKVVTRDGSVVKVMCRDPKRFLYPVIAYIDDYKYNFTENGLFRKGEKGKFDLFFADKNIVKKQSAQINGLCWRKCKAGYKFPSDAIVIPDDERTTDRDPRLVRCAIWDSIYILVSDLKNLPIEE